MWKGAGPWSREIQDATWFSGEKKRKVKKLFFYQASTVVCELLDVGDFRERFYRGKAKENSQLAGT